MARFFYSILYLTLTPVFLLSFLLLSRKNPQWRKRLAERFGRVPHHPPAGGIWLHAASVGEVQACVPLVKVLQEQRPKPPIIITTFTPTGSEQVRKIFGDGVYHMYIPLDITWVLRRFLNKIRPNVLVLIERELWPNMLAVCEAQQVAVLLANARLSEKSLRSYQKFSALVQPMLKRLSVVAVQNPVDGQRYLELGLAANKLEVTGSMKFDIELAAGLEQEGQALRAQWGASRTVLALASSHEDEDERLLDLYPELQAQCPSLLLLLVPRHPERFDAVVNAAHARRLKVQRRSAGAANNSTQVYVADTLGEMLKVLSAADLVLMGGSLIERGGHNPIEPAALGKPVLIGPHYFNFSEIVDGLVTAGATQVVSDQNEALAATLTELLNNPAERERMGQAGLAVVAKNRGAVKALVQHCQELRQ